MPTALLTLVVLADPALDPKQRELLAAAEAMFAPGARNPDSARLTFADFESKCGFTVPLKLDPSLVPVAQKLASKPGREPDLIWTSCLAMAESVMYSCEDAWLKEGLRAKVKGLRCQATADGEAHGKYELVDGTLVMTFGAKPARDMDTIEGRGRAFLKKNGRPAPKALEGGLNEQQQQVLDDVRWAMAASADTPGSRFNFVDSSRFRFQDVEAQCGFGVPLEIHPSTVPVAEQLQTDDEKRRNVIYSRCFQLVEALIYTCREAAAKKDVLRAKVKELVCRGDPAAEAHGAVALKAGKLTLTWGLKPAKDADTILARGQRALQAALGGR